MFPLLILLAAAPPALPAARGGGLENETGAFRERLQRLPGQPVQILVDELGPGEAGERNGRRTYGWGYQIVYSDRPAEACLVGVTVDQAERVIAVEIRGGDHTCSIVLDDLRGTQARYRNNPGLREREAEQRRRTLEGLTGLRRSIASPTPQ